MNILLILNLVFFLSPIILAFLITPPGKSWANEGSGGGAALWLYIMVLPISTIVQLVLMVLKIIFAQQKNDIPK